MNLQGQLPTSRQEHHEQLLTINALAARCADVFEYAPQAEIAPVQFEGETVGDTVRNIPFSKRAVADIIRSGVHSERSRDRCFYTITIHPSDELPIGAPAVIELLPPGAGFHNMHSEQFWSGRVDIYPRNDQRSRRTVYLEEIAVLPTQAEDTSFMKLAQEIAIRAERTIAQYAQQCAAKRQWNSSSRLAKNQEDIVSLIRTKLGL
jgi:hypothetical protein